MDLFPNGPCRCQIITGEHNHLKALILHFSNRFFRIGLEVVGYGNQAAKPIVSRHHHHRFALGLQLPDLFGYRFNGNFQFLKPAGLSHHHCISVNACLNPLSAVRFEFLRIGKREPLSFSMPDNCFTKRMLRTLFNRGAEFQKIPGGMALRLDWNDVHDGGFADGDGTRFIQHHTIELGGHFKGLAVFKQNPFFCGFAGAGHDCRRGCKP